MSVLVTRKVRLHNFRQMPSPPAVQALPSFVKVISMRSQPWRPLRPPGEAHVRQKLELANLFGWSGGRSRWTVQMSVRRCHHHGNRARSMDCARQRAVGGARVLVVLDLVAVLMMGLMRSGSGCKSGVKDELDNLKNCS